MGTVTLTISVIIFSISLCTTIPRIYFTLTHNRSRVGIKPLLFFGNHRIYKSGNVQAHAHLFSKIIKVFESPQTLCKALACVYVVDHRWKHGMVYARHIRVCSTFSRQSFASWKLRRQKMKYHVSHDTTQTRILSAPVWRASRSKGECMASSLVNKRRRSSQQSIHIARIRIPVLISLAS